MVNSVSFGTKMGVFERPNIDAPQSYPRPVAPSATDKAPKKHKVLKTIAGIVATAAVVAGGLAAGSKFGIFKADKVAKLAEKLHIKDASWLQWAKEPAKKALSGLDTAGNFVINKSTAVYNVTSEYVKKGIDWVKGLFNKAA